MIKYILIVLLFVSTQTVQAQWIDFQSITNRQAKGKFLTDIYSHCTNPYVCNDLITCAHESTHDVHSYLNNHNHGFEVLYCLDNHAFKIKKVPFKLSQLANSIPTKYRGSIFNLYLVSQRQYFEDSPTYVLDEGIAYQNGVTVGIELKIGQGTYSELNNAFEMNIYSIFLAKMAKQKDLYEFVTWQTIRNLNLYDQIKQTKTDDLIFQHMTSKYKVLQQVISETK